MPCLHPFHYMSPSQLRPQALIRADEDTLFFLGHSTYSNSGHPYCTKQWCNFFIQNPWSIPPQLQLCKKNRQPEMLLPLLHLCTVFLSLAIIGHNVLHLPSMNFVWLNLDCYYIRVSLNPAKCLQSGVTHIYFISMEILPLSTLMTTFAWSRGKDRPLQPVL